MPRILREGQGDVWMVGQLDSRIAEISDMFEKKEKKNVEFLQFLLFYFKVDFHQVLSSFV